MKRANRINCPRIHVDINLHIQIGHRGVLSTPIDGITAAVRMIWQTVIRIESINDMNTKVTKPSGKEIRIGIYGRLRRRIDRHLIKRGVRDIILHTFHQKSHQVKFPEEINLLKGARRFRGNHEIFHGLCRHLHQIHHEID